MFKLLVVDDEPIVRAGIRKMVENMVDWSVLGEAGNGNEAVACIAREAPDLILCDIRMPECDGIQLMKLIRSQGCDIPLVFLTGHPDFAYAQEALRHGALDYLLKPCLAQDISAVLEKAEVLLSERRARQQYVSTMLESMVRGLLYGGPFSERFDLSGHAFLAANHYNVISLRIVAPYVYGTELIVQAVGEAWSGIPHTLLADGSREFALVMANEDNAGEGDIAKRAAAIGQGRGVVLLSGIGGIAKRGELNQSYVQSKIALRLAHEDNRTVCYSKLTMPGVVPIAKTIELEMRLLQAVKNGLADETDTCVAQLGESLSHLPAQELSHRLYVLYMQLLDGAGLVLEQSGAEQPSPLMRLDETDREAMIAEFTGRVRQICTQVRQQHMLETNFIVRRAVQLIQEKFKENVTLKEIAAKLCLSPAYLSVLFKQETGQTFSDYLIDCRMKEAKRLLADPTYKVYEVARDVGYVDGRHFSQVFKSWTGNTPQEFRNRCLRGDG